MMTMDVIREIAQDIDTNREQYIKINDAVWEYAEPGLQEYRSSKLLADTLSDSGFDVSFGVSGMETAFRAIYGESAPVITFVAEYDALPGLSQKAGCTEHSPLEEGAYGHGCGHNIMGTCIIAAAIAAKEYMEKHSIKGTLQVIGTPAEETAGAKAYMVRDGVFSDTDICIGIHSAWFNAVQSYGMPACRTVRFHFKGKASHAGTAPHLGRSALDACELTNIGVNYLREHVLPSTRMSYCYENAGPQADNVVPDYACLRYGLRAETSEALRNVYDRVIKVAKGAAMMTETRCDIEPLMGMSEFISNDTLGEFCSQVMKKTGEPDFDHNDDALATRYFNMVTEEGKDASVRHMDLCYGNAAHLRNQALIREVASYRPKSGSIMGGSDICDISHVVPTAHFLITMQANATPGHSWQQTAQGSTSIAHKGLLFGAKAMAASAVLLFQRPEIITVAKEELLKKTGGKYTSPLEPEQKPGRL